MSREGGEVLPLWPNRVSDLFEGPAKDYQMAQFREITLPLGGILVVTTLYEVILTNC